MYGKSPLRRTDREMIAVVVSAINQCHYWIVHHGEGLLKLTKNESLKAFDQYKIEYNEFLEIPATKINEVPIAKLNKLIFNLLMILNLKLYLYPFLTGI